MKLRKTLTTTRKGYPSEPLVVFGVLIDSDNPFTAVNVHFKTADIAKLLTSCLYEASGLPSIFAPYSS